MTNLTGSNLNRREATGPKGEGRDSPSKFPQYPEYKDSGVEWLGEVPAHWEVKRLRYVAELNPSKSEVRSLPAESSVSFIPMEAVGEDGSLSLDQTRPIGEVLAGYTFVREGDVTIAKITPCFENGKGAVMRGLENRVGFGTTELIVMRPKARLTTSNYLYRVVSSEPFRVLGESSMYGAGGQKRVPDDFVRNFSIAWPPYKEQEEIQAFLDHETARIDALVEQQQRLIKLLKEKRQAVLSHAVTKGLDPEVPMKDSGVEWLGEVPAHWVRKRLKNVTPFITVGIVVNPSNYLAEEGLPFIYGGEVREGYIVVDKARKISLEDSRRNRKTMLEAGDVVTMRVGYPGVTAVVPPECEGGNCASVMLIKKGDYDSRWLCSAMNSRLIRHQVEIVQYGAAQKQFNIADAMEFWLFQPPVGEQVSIADYIDHESCIFDQLIDEANRNMELLKERRSALISAAVTGKIDVSGWQPPAGSTASIEAAQTEAV
ncbi:restriction endonuclease subunit S [Halomonas lysinitropha]|uniref:Type-1 restriction enzyme EcoKI specificity protein n=1 Tax=Halomonas lysinitropha TaxID=2607506 RepID=A0A5K1I7N3_9GAMM|nr:restriction endonuclease subunit S [Halomonas lysinitropha]VVZ96143.1 Type-1 restriction enzyme EcoKI specificity protein [Halomonas lysinitropha]